MMKKKTCLWVCVMSDFDLNWFTPGRRQSKTLIQPTNLDKKSLEIEFLIAICHPSGDKWQSKTLFLSIFDPSSSIVKSVFDCHLPSLWLSLTFFPLLEITSIK